VLSRQPCLVRHDNHAIVAQRSRLYRPARIG